MTFTVKKGGGVFTNDAGTMTVTTDSDGRATVNMILGPEAGNDVHWAEATFPGNTGSPAVFVATGLIPGDPGETRISGVILDNMNQPVPGVTARVDGTTRQDASDSQGQFVIDNVPIGPVHLIIEGSTATVPGEWPLLSFELTTIAGANNTLGKPIYILPIDIARAKRVGGTKDVVYTLPEVPGFSLTVKAGSVTFPDGSQEGLISVTPVHMDKVPMSPPYGLQSRFMITIQPPGAVFDPPAPLSLPNTDGLERGEKVNLFSFDHDLGAFVSIGPGSVSSDGIRVVSDPGVGVIKAGWHCGANPQPVGMCQSEPPMCGGQLTGCGACEICDTTNCWRLPDCYEACGGARCGSCEDCVDGSCVLETRGNPPCQPLAGSCRDCPVEWDCVTCENSICIFRGCGGPADDDGTCAPGCDTCAHCSQGRCYPDDTCEDDSSSCVGTCGSCQVCRSDSCVRDGRCDMDDQESNGNEGDFCSSVLPCRECLQCENSACAVGDLPACLDNLDVVITPPGPIILPVGGTQRLTSVGGPLAGTYAWSSSDAGVARIQGSSTARNITIEGLSAGTTTATVSFTAGGKTVTDTVDVTVVEVEILNVDAINPTNTKVNYQVVPLSAVLDTVTFTAPGTTQTRSNVSGSFYFSFDQTNLPLGSSAINLTATKYDWSIVSNTVANREGKVTSQAQEMVTAYFLIEGVGVRIYGHRLSETYHQVSYSVPYSGKTIWVGESMASLYLGGDYSNIGDLDWGETHKHTYAVGETAPQEMTTSLGFGNPDTRYKESSDDIWPEPAGLTGVATIKNLFYDSVVGAIINANVDRSIP